MKEDHRKSGRPTAAMRLRRIWSVPRNRALLLASPVLVPLLPVAYPVYVGLRHLRKRRKTAKKTERKTEKKHRRDPRATLGELAGELSSVAPTPRDDATEARMDALADTFAFCRVIGNDLVPRHKAGQSIENLRFILENEPELEGCTKLWLLNRIFDPETEAALIDLLERHGQAYERLPYDPEVLQQTGYDFDRIGDPGWFFDGRAGAARPEVVARMHLQTFRLRNNYVMNNNGARNHALEMCRKVAKWSLPFDGNCYFSPSAWQSFRSGVIAQRQMRYFTVPMARLLDNRDLLAPGFTPPAEEEPQIAFRQDAAERFDPAHPYGRRPKVELFAHLGIEGPWTDWFVNDFDVPPRKVSGEGYRVSAAGWVARLFSGHADLEQAGKGKPRSRGIARDEAIRLTLDMLERRGMRGPDSAARPVFYHADRLGEGRIDAAVLIRMADEAMTRGPFSVTDKPEPGPSGRLQDYYHPAPYWWPDSKRPDGLPYVRRDGERIAGTVMYEAGNERYDRSRMQRLFDDTTTLALAARLDGSRGYRDHAIKLVRTWFLDPATAMAPHLDSAQVRRGHDDDRGQPVGLIETKDFCYFLDAVALLDDAGLTAGLRLWCGQFLDWLETSPQGMRESAAINNHGTFYDLQCAALAAFLGDDARLRAINWRAQARALASITADGQQPHELTRTMSLHYATFNLQGWVTLFDLLEGTGLRPWSSAAGHRVLRAIKRLLDEVAAGWSAPQIKPFDHRRLVPLATALPSGTPVRQDADADAPDCFSPDDGIPPFWRLGRGRMTAQSGAADRFCG